VIYGCTSAEKEISAKEGERTTKLLRSHRHSVYPIRVDDTAEWLQRLGGAPRHAILCVSEDVGIQWALGALEIRHNGSGPLATMLSFDKLLTKMLLAQAGISTPRWQSFSRGGAIAPDVITVGYPMVVKPVRGGSSHGLSVVDGPHQLKDAATLAFLDDRQILVEEFVDGTEITVVCLGARILGIVELLKDARVYTYATKLEGHIEYREPARIETTTRRYIEAIVQLVIDVFGVRNIWRLDAVVVKNTPFVLEINTLPFLAEGGEPYEAVRNKGWGHV
jgi:D-alanine-D-alanine ligase